MDTVVSIQNGVVKCTSGHARSLTKVKWLEDSCGNGYAIFEDHVAFCPWSLFRLVRRMGKANVEPNPVCETLRQAGSRHVD
ncbi:MAG: hypothetical protein DRP01_03740 [Archaeoglobales archaeon]|nr:MAG: hypothetical protein DRP01_03740 [Archaeoglobales archaeon]